MPEKYAVSGPARGPCQACTHTLALHGQLAVGPGACTGSTNSKISAQHMRRCPIPTALLGRSAPAKSDNAKTDTAKPAQLGEEVRRYPSEQICGKMRAPQSPENNTTAGLARGPCQACTRTLALHGQLTVGPGACTGSTNSKISAQHMRGCSILLEHPGRSDPATPDMAKTHTAKPTQLGEEVRRYPSECTRSRKADAPQHQLSVYVPARAKVEVANENNV